MRYTREDGCRAWLTHGLIRADNLARLLQEYGSAEAIYEKFTNSEHEFIKAYVNEYGLSKLIERASRDKMHEMMVTMQKLDMGILSQNDAGYPESLKNIQFPPALLFYRGNLECLNGKCVAVVGARKASPQGIETTRKLCAELSRSGVTVVSGLAMGIDTAAHEGCLEGGSPTAGVLGCGLDVDYPVENETLKERIINSGGVLLSEYPPGYRANKHVFHVRNRIISGLARALLMMESRIQSGSMLTVHHALDQGREVYAYPGMPGTEWAEGAHQLLREGANYFTNAQDILEDLGWERESPCSPLKQNDNLPPMNDDQRKVFSLLSQGELTFDQLASATHLPTPTLTVSLTMLQMMGLIKAMPGKAYCRV